MSTVFGTSNWSEVTSSERGSNEFGSLVMLNDFPLTVEADRALEILVNLFEGGLELGDGRIT